MAATSVVGADESAAEVAEDGSRGTKLSLHRSTVDGGEPELGIVSIEPLIVVEERPVKITVNVDAMIITKLFEDAHVFMEKACAMKVVSVSKSVLGDDDRQSVFRGFDDQRLEIRRHDLPTVVCETAARAIEVTEVADEALPAGTAQMKSRVVVDAGEVESIDQVAILSANERPWRKEKVPFARAKGRQQARVVEAVSDARDH